MTAFKTCKSSTAVSEGGGGGRGVPLSVLMTGFTTTLEVPGWSSRDTSPFTTNLEVDLRRAQQQLPRLLADGEVSRDALQRGRPRVHLAPRVQHLRPVGDRRSGRALPYHALPRRDAPEPAAVRFFQRHPADTVGPRARVLGFQVRLLVDEREARQEPAVGRAAVRNLALQRRALPESQIDAAHAKFSCREAKDAVQTRGTRGRLQANAPHRRSPRCACRRLPDSPPPPAP